MKKTTLTLVGLSIVLFFLMSCKKEKEINHIKSTTYCSPDTFQVELSMSLPIDISEDYNSNTIILGYAKGYTAVIKLDQYGTLKWQKSYPEIKGNVQNIITLSDNSIIISSGYSTRQNFEHVQLNALYEQGYINPNTCQTTYRLGEGYENHSYIGKSILTKLNADGQLLWTKELDGGFCLGNTITNTKADNIILMGYLNYGLQAEPVYDSLGVFQDIVNFPRDRNKLYLYEIDYNGSISWQKSLNNIYDYNYDYCGYRNVVYTDSYIVVNMQRDLLIFDHQGNEVRRFIPVSPLCNNELIAISKADDDNIYLSGAYSRYNDTLQTTPKYPYFSKIAADGNIIWTKEMQGNLTYLLNDAVAIHGEDIGSIYNSSGNLLLSSNYLKTSCVSKTCNGGYISVLFEYPNKIIVKKSNI